MEWGVPAGYGPSEAGAVGAAMGWVASLGPLMRLGPVALRDALAAVMTATAAADTFGSFGAERERFTLEFGADPVLGIWIDSPLAVSVVSFDPARAVVAVWSQLLLGVTADTVSVLWRTQTVTVVWAGGSWLVDDVVRTEGPTPVVVDGQLPSPGSAFAELVGWTPAVLAVSGVER